VSYSKLHAARLLRKAAHQSASEEHINGDPGKLRASSADAVPLDVIPAVHRAWVPHLEPKVMAAYTHAPGETPREVLVQRSRKAYLEFDLSGALRSGGIDHSTADGAKAIAGHIALHVFDDEVFESRTHQEWVPGAPAEAAAARVLLLNDIGVGCFVQARIVGVDASRNQYEATFPQTQLESQWLHRLYVCFDAEDPQVYSRRLMRAYQGRRQAESALLYNLLIDSMPYGDMPQFNVEQINRMLNYALNNKALKTQMKLMDTSMLISEINIEHARALNRILFDHIRRPPPLVPAISGLQPGDATTAHFPALPLAELFVVEGARCAPACGTAAIEPHDFPETFSQFVFASLLTKNEVIAALVKARAECVKVMEKTLFHLIPAKTMPILEFLQVRPPILCNSHVRPTKADSFRLCVARAMQDNYALTPETLPPCPTCNNTVEHL
jgi:dynein heavy chain, axonemal